ncbi:hypothetical protein L2E82_53726 [Cichorium intybus]|nr:hypothetical protein L2E82_53726 [Cichorium intybus]
MDESVKSRVNVRSSKDGASPLSRSRSGAKTNTPATYCTGPSTRHSTFVESEPIPLHCARTVERPPALPCTDRFILRTWSSLTTLRGLVRTQLVEHWAFNLMVAGSSPAIPKPNLHYTMSKDA